MKKRRWENCSDDALLATRLCDLNLSLADSHVGSWVQQAVRELKSSGLGILPQFYVGDEWFTPDGEIAVSIPFFVLHPRLSALETKMLGECEGESRLEFMKLLRHEIGHCFDHAFQLSQRRQWQKIFGSPEREYNPDTYVANGRSRAFVRNISEYYAQSHPLEDFAETFAVWLNPRSQWRTRYRDWACYKKLLYVDQLAEEFAGASVKKARGRLLSDIRFLRSSLDRYYVRRLKNLENYYVHKVYS